MAYNYTPTASGGTGLDQIDDTKPLGSEDPSVLDDVLRQIRAALKDLFLRNHDKYGNLDMAKVNALNPGAGGFVPTGGWVMWPNSVVPSGWLECNGQAVSRVTYAALFAVYGVQFGAGDGSTTFNLPNMSCLSPMGAGARGGYTTRTLQTVIGAEEVTLGVPHIPPHSHTFSALRDGNPEGGGNVSGTRGDYKQYTTDSTGGGQPHPNVHPCFCVKFICRT